jgi:hypothetical protein
VRQLQALLCKAALEAPWHVPCGGVPYGDDNLCFIANDWHTSLLPVYLQVHTPPSSQLTTTIRHAHPNEVGYYSIDTKHVVPPTHVTLIPRAHSMR